MEKWTKAIQQLYSRDRTGLKAGEEDGEETKGFVMGYGLASPLFKFTPIRSALLHMVSGTTGSGKTSTLRAVASIWGHPKDALSQGGDTTFSWFQKQCLSLYTVCHMVKDETGWKVAPIG